MGAPALHRFEHGGKRFVVDTETCFCFECDAVSWAVLEHYPETPVNRIAHLVGQDHSRREVEEVIGELEWLRSTKAILPRRSPAELLKQFEVARALQRVDVWTDACGAGLAGAMALLLGRSRDRDAIALHVHPGGPVAGLAEALEAAIRDARLAGKSLEIVLEAPASLSGRDARALGPHGLSLAWRIGPEAPGASLRAFDAASGKGLSGLAGSLNGVAAILTPASGAFRDAVVQLHGAGFTRIEIDLPAAYQRDPGLDPAAVLEGMRAAAVYYAQQLLAGKHFRLEPIAATFHQIYEGAPRPRSDASGTHELAVDARGEVYPSRYFVGQDAFRLGSVAEGRIDEDRRAPFDDLGAISTSPCNTCWARNLCGGGHSAIHAARTGAIRTPDPAWCDRQRDWFASAIAAFNLLSSQGVNFDRIYQSVQPAGRPSLWQAAKAAMTLKAGVRPIAEADAPLLARWENWSESVYFLGNEYGTFLATRYDREMDSLHPRGIEQELVIISRRGDPIGLLKIRPEPRLQLARVWIYLRDPQQYADPGLRRSFRHILGEAARHDAFSTLVAAVGPGDPGLGDFLLASGFTHAGRERAALFLHDAYHDIDMYSVRLS